VRTAGEHRLHQASVMRWLPTLPRCQGQVAGAGAASCVSRNGTDALGVGGAGAPSSGGEDRDGPDGPDRATQSSTRTGDEGEGRVTPIGDAEEHEAVTPVGEAEGCESKVAETVEAAGAVKAGGTPAA
jgi:hypothetical protein